MKRIMIGISCALVILTAPVFGTDRGQSDLAQIVDSARHNDAVAVEKLIQRSLALRQKIPTFVDDADKATASRKGAIPAALSATIASSIGEAAPIRTMSFRYALRYRSTL